MGEKLRTLWNGSPFVRFAVIFEAIAAVALLVTGPGGTSSTISQSPIVKEATAVALTVDRSAVYGEPVTLTAQVSGSGSTPTGSVQFQIDGSDFGPAAVQGDGTARIDAPTLPVGTHQIAATYLGDTRFDQSRAPGGRTIAIEPVTTLLTLTPNPVTSDQGRPVTIQIQVAAAAPSTAVPSGSVVIKEQSGAVAGTVPVRNGQGTSIVDCTTAGSRLLTMEFTPDTPNFSARTTYLTQTVNAPSPPRIEQTWPPVVAPVVASDPSSPADVSSTLMRPPFSRADPSTRVTVTPSPIKITPTPKGPEVPKPGVNEGDFVGTWVRTLNGRKISEVTLDRNQVVREDPPRVGRSPNYYETDHGRLDLRLSTIGHDNGEDTRLERGPVQWKGGDQFVFEVNEGPGEHGVYVFQRKH